MSVAINTITNLQIELMKLFSYNLEEQQLIEIKELLAKYFAEKASVEMDKLWDKRRWTNKTMDKWAKEHLRTPY